MPRPTTALPPPRRAGPVNARPFTAGDLAAPLIAGALYAAIEFFLVGGFLFSLAAQTRAEAALFLAVRPTLLVLAAPLVAHWRLPRRVAFYAFAIVLVGASETVLVLCLGNESPWRELGGGIAAGAIVAAAADLLLQALRRWNRWGGSIIGTALILLLLPFATGLRPYEALVLGPTGAREAAAPKPRLILMTALPIVWGTGGAFDPNSRPAETFRALEREYDVHPVDAIDAAALRGARLMLLAQPRVLAPEELVALDQWVRDGGKILILTDPFLAASGTLPLLDVRRPPERGLLDPLLSHWGVRLEETEEDDVVDHLTGPGGRRRLALFRPGGFAATGNSCRIAGKPWLARCRIGRGEALLVADADLLTDPSWVGLADAGSERHLRTADNPLVVADWLDGLAGLSRPRAERLVAWVAPHADRGRAQLFAALPILLALALGLVLLYKGRRMPTTLSTGLRTENSNRTEVTDDP